MVNPLTKLASPLGEALATRPDGLKRLAEGALIAVLAIQAGRAVWLFLDPPADPPAISGAVAADPAILTRIDPFTGGAGASGPVSEDNGGYGLFGISADGAGGGSAIIGLPDGSQVSVAVGEAVADGVTLESVEMDHVILNAGSRRLKVAFPDINLNPAEGAAEAGADSGNGTAAEATPTVAAATLVDPQALMAEAGLRPAMNGLHLKGLSVTAKGEAPQLAAAGLQDGDIILSVNGTALTSPQALNTLRQRLASAPRAEISYERDGQRRMTTIRTH